MRREIIYAESFKKAVDALGGYRAVDRAVDTVLDGLVRNPYAFNKFESDFVSFRFATTSPIGDLPSLVIIFQIDQPTGNVVLEHVEENDPFY